MSIVAVNSITDASGGNTVSINGYSPTESNMAGRNAIINGNFDHWQRGTSFTVGSSEIYTVDRWVCRAGNTGNVSVSLQPFAVGQTEVPNNPVNYVRLTGTNNPSDLKFLQKIEDVRTFAGQTVTVSFWAKADTAKTFGEGGYFQQQFGSGGSSDVNTNIGPWSVTTSWQKITITVALPSISGKTVGANSHLILRFDTNNNENVVLDIAQVQLEAGSVATPFERRPVGTELALCQRYYEISRTSFQYSNQFNGDQIFASGDFKTKKRTGPTLSILINNNFNVGSFSTFVDVDRYGLVGNLSATGVARLDCQIAADAEL